ncbi:hypothetical protein DH2020_036252 [Rehmannia glutinosa]|uniref:AAA+ ATPase domain-containing protein n=1 Tax=Rehmannia glutinosa TaxID=99300 RepID=A0ABR0V577_REHGL
MESKHVLMSLGVGIGVGVGLGLASGTQTVGKGAGGVSAHTMEQEMLSLVANGRDSNVTFDQFPYYLSEQTRVLLSSAAFVHLKKADFIKHTRNLSPASRTILLSGPAELYQQMLAKALAHYFEAKLLLLDVTDFSLKSFKRSISETTLGRMSGLLGSFSMLQPKEESKACKLLIYPRSSNVLPNRAVFAQDAILWIAMALSVLMMHPSDKFLHNVRIWEPYYMIISLWTIRRQSSGADLASNGYEVPNPAKLRRNASASSNINNLASTSAPATSECLERKNKSYAVSFSFKPDDAMLHKIVPCCPFLLPIPSLILNFNFSAPLKRASSWCFDDKLLIQTLYKVLANVSKTNPIILYLRDVEQFLCRSQRAYVMFQKMLKKLSGAILILGSRIIDPENDYRLVDEKISAVFPYNIEIRPPQDENHLVSWKSQLEEDMKMIQYQDNKNHIIEVLAANDLDCDDLGSICFPDTIVLSNYIEEIVVSAISYHLTNAKEPQYKNGKLVISSTSLSHGLSIFQEGKSAGKDTMKLEARAEMPKGVPDGGAVISRPEGKSETTGSESKSDEPPKTPGNAPDNEFEKRIRPEVIPASEIGVTFADIGALDEIKESLQELVLLPLRRPDLFEGGLLKPCRGILLFGPPGTGKTMMAKAIANEAGASFINVSMSTVTSKWFGEDEKNVRALFTLAAKRNRAGEHEAMRKIKNEFMTHWDGLLSKPGERILVLAATNRPFDLDEAIIRRFERRIMVGLPSVENREKILRTLLSKEKVDEGLDFMELATMTEGYSGSDLKKRKAEEGQECGNDADKKERVITIRPLNMEDLKEAKNQVAASFAAEGAIMNELKQWNDLYGEGGSRKKEQLSYFL